MNGARAILADVVTRLFTERVTRELRQSAETGEWPGALWAAVDRLSPQQRAAILLQMEDLSTSEIAGILACTEATVRVHLHRALSTLRKTLGER